MTKKSDTDFVRRVHVLVLRQHPECYILYTA